jgi:hypothetical protein
MRTQPEPRQPEGGAAGLLLALLIAVLVGIVADGAGVMA